MKRSKTKEVEDIIWGCVQPTLEQGFNIARMASIMAGLPQEVAAQTVNRLCGSSMTAVHTAAMSIQSGNGDVFIVGGVEHMGHVPMMHGVDINPALSHNTTKIAGMMGMTAEALGMFNGISRQAQDEFAYESHMRAARATENKEWANGCNSQWYMMRWYYTAIDYDEVVRPETTVEGLSKYVPPLIQGWYSYCWKLFGNLRRCSWTFDHVT